MEAIYLNIQSGKDLDATGGLNFNGGRHYGIDFGMPSGTNVYAVKGGIADKVWTDYSGGNSIQIKTGANEWNWYMHLSKQLARQGQRIKAGQLIGNQVLQVISLEEHTYISN